MNYILLMICERKPDGTSYKEHVCGDMCFGLFKTMPHYLPKYLYENGQSDCNMKRRNLIRKAQTVTWKAIKESILAEVMPF